MSFDRVATIYDETRALPPDVMERIARRVVAATHAAPATRFLEIGVGTGRIALPFVGRGYPYVGVDISTLMMDRLRSKLPPRAQNVTLLEGEATNLPVEDASVDVVLTVHVLHLIPDWKTALQEARRVLRPDGYFVEGHDWSVPGDPGDAIRSQWRALVEQTGTKLRRDHGTARAVEAELTRQGCRTAVYRVAQWEQELRPIRLLDEQRNRTYSLSWDVPEDVLKAVHEKMVVWARETYGDIERPLRSRYEFMLSVSRFPED